MATLNNRGTIFIHVVCVCVHVCGCGHACGCVNMHSCVCSVHSCGVYVCMYVFGGMCLMIFCIFVVGSKIGTQVDLIIEITPTMIK